MYLSFAGAEETLTFDQAVSAARSMLTQLSVLASSLQIHASSNSPEQGLADQAKRYATVGGPAMLQRAINERSVARLEDLQQVGLNIIHDMNEALTDSTIMRFFFATILGPVALVPGVSERSKDLFDAGTDKLAPGARSANDAIHSFEDVVSAIGKKIADTATGKNVDPVVVGVGVLGAAIAVAYVVRSFK